MIITEVELHIGNYSDNRQKTIIDDEVRGRIIFKL